MERLSTRTPESSNPALRSWALPFFPGLLQGSKEILDVKSPFCPSQEMQREAFSYAKGGVGSGPGTPRAHLERGGHFPSPNPAGNESVLLPPALGSQLPALSFRRDLALQASHLDVTANRLGLRVPLFPLPPALGSTESCLLRSKSSDINLTSSGSIAST